MSFSVFAVSRFVLHRFPLETFISTLNCHVSFCNGAEQCVITYVLSYMPPSRLCQIIEEKNIDKMMAVTTVTGSQQSWNARQTVTWNLTSGLKRSLDTLLLSGLSIQSILFCAGGLSHIQACPHCLWGSTSTNLVHC